MMFDRLIDFQNRSSGSVAVLRIPPNRTLDKLHINLPAGVTKSQILRIEGKLNDRTFFVDTGVSLTKKDSYLSGVFGFVDSQIITIDFTEPGARGGAPEMYLTSIPVNLIGKVVFEITIAESVTNAQAAAITADNEYRGPTGNPFVLRRRDINQALPIAGENDLLIPSKESGGLIKRIFIEHTGNIKSAELRGDGQTKYRFDLTNLGYVQKRNGMVPQTNLAVLDFVAAGNVAQAFNTKGFTESLLRLTTSGADVARIYVDFVDHWNAV